MAPLKGGCMTKNINEENPLGILGIDHLEFTTDNLGGNTSKLFNLMGFEKTHENQAAKSELFSQGQVRFVMTANQDPTSQSRRYFDQHGEGVNKISFLVEDAQLAIEQAHERGAETIGDLVTLESEEGLHRSAMIQGFGDVINEFIERPRSKFNPLFKESPSTNSQPLNTRVSRIDHLTNNVPKGEMRKWVEFYEKVYGFKVTRYFDIKGSKTGLQSEVVQLANNSVIIPINEPSEDNSKSQIQEFLDLHQGAGVQHIALMTPDIISTVGQLQDRGINFLDIPSTYYEDIPKRPFVVEEAREILEKNQLLVDGDKDGYLLQIFSETCIGPLFFEYIQRKNHWGFGEGNFQALFDAIERDQMKRGYLE